MKTNIVVGAGQAGAHAAMAMRHAGFRGRIILVGDEDVLPYDRTPLSKRLLLSAGEVNLTLFHDAASYASHQVELVLGKKVEAIEPDKGWIRLPGGPISYDRLIFATGSSARRPDIPGSEHIMTLRTASDASKISSKLQPGKNIVCIGAGVIGLEAASAARARGCNVTIVEAGPMLMSRSLAPNLADVIATIHRRAGVEFLFDATVEMVEGGQVILEGGLRLEADAIIAGIGVERNLALAQHAGVAVNRGIVTDGSGLTNVDGVYAAGDVAEFFSRRTGEHTVLEAWKHAQDHGALVGRVTAGADESYDEVPWFWSDQQGVNIQVAGTALAGARTVYRGDPTSSSFSAFFLGQNGRLAGAFGLNAGSDISAAIRLMRRDQAVDPAALADLRLTPQKLVAAASVQQVGI